MTHGSHRTFPGFDAIHLPGARILTRPEAVAWVKYVAEGGDDLYAAAARDKHTARLEGRGPVFVIPAKLSKESETGARWWAVRHYTRGGRLVPLLMGDRYLRVGRVRPYHEVAVSEAARARGISTPRVVAGAMYPSGPFYRADLVTEFVPNASDLADVLFDSKRKGAGGASERLDALRATTELLQRMAAVGLKHRDIHARNILLEWKGAAPTAHLLDLDRCDIAPIGAAQSAGPMIGRLRRSLKKWEQRTGIRISDREWKTLDLDSTG